MNQIILIVLVIALIVIVGYLLFFREPFSNGASGTYAEYVTNLMAQHVPFSRVYSRDAYMIAKNGTANVVNEIVNANY